MLTVEHLCTYIIRLVHAPIFVYDESGNHIATYVDSGEQENILDCDFAYKDFLLEKRQKDYPVLYLETNEIIYGIIFDGSKTYILGPCCLGRDYVTAGKYLVRTHHMNSKLPYRIARCSLNVFGLLILMLFEAATGIVMDRAELFRQNFCNLEFERAYLEKLNSVIYDLREADAVHNPYSQELREQESIRTGNLDALHKSLQEIYVGRYGTLSTDPLRNMKNLCISVVAVACRSAIAGGMLPEVAFSMSDAFIQRIEEVNSEGEAYAVARHAEVEYCTDVKNLSMQTPRNVLVTQCKELIVQKIHSKLSVQELALQLEITPGYLSSLFIKEEGMKLTDYIAKEKVDAAKGRLAYSDDTYEMIAFSYGYASQSHFGQVFKKWTGMTPKQYRETRAKKRKK